MTTKKEWSSFLKSASQTLRAVLNNDIGLEQAYLFFESAKILDHDLRECIYYFISEVDSERDNYMKLLHLLEQGATEQELNEFMDK